MRLAIITQLLCQTADPKYGHAEIVNRRNMGDFQNQGFVSIDMYLLLNHSELIFNEQY